MPFTHVAFLSLDSLVAGCVLAPLLPGASRRLAAAGLFGVADAAASSLGGLVSPPLHGGLAQAPGLLALYALFLVVATRMTARGGEATEYPGARTWAIVGALAVALSLDNLVSTGATHAGPAAVVAGAGSAAFMLMGLALGARVVRALPDPLRRGWLTAGVATMACLAVLG